MILTYGYELPLDAFLLFDVITLYIEFHTVDAYSSWGLTSVKYNINKLSRVQKEQIIVQTKFSIFMDWEKM